MQGTAVKNRTTIKQQRKTVAKKKKEETADNFFSELASDAGGVLLAGSGDSKYFIDTGNLALNFVCTGGRFMQGGIPTGTTEVYGPSASAKSLVGYALMGRNQKRGGYNILLDCERAANETFAQVAGHLDPKQVIVVTPNYIEDVQNKIIGMTHKIRARDKTAPILFIWDSIGVTMCEREFRETKLPLNYTKEQYKKIVGGKEQPGERAKAASAFFRKINPFLDEQNVVLFVVNQIRSKIGVMYGSPETTAGGGNALPFYANTRIRSSAQKRIDHKKRKVAIGMNLRFTNKKCRSGPPFMESEGIQLYFAAGMNPLSGLLAALVADGRIEATSAGRYKVNEPYAKGEEYVFQASLAKGVVPLELLTKFPQIVDADSQEEVKDYLADFKNVMTLSDSEDIEEVEKNMDELGIDASDDESD